MQRQKRRENYLNAFLLSLSYILHLTLFNQTQLEAKEQENSGNGICRGQSLEAQRVKSMVCIKAWLVGNKHRKTDLFCYSHPLLTFVWTKNFNLNPGEI
jgi:hypothetical protein